jgi:hypothetical protein
MDDDAHPGIGEGDEAVRPALVLGHERRAEPTPVIGKGDLAECEHARVRRVGLDAQAATEATVGSLHHSDVPVAIDRGRSPMAQEPLGRDDARADERLSLLARESRDRGGVLIPGRPKTKAGRRRHADSLHR